MIAVLPVVVGLLVPQISDAEMEKVFSTYYKNPQPNKVPLILKRLHNDQRLASEDLQAVVVGFMAGAMKRNPDRIAAWFEVVKTYPKEERRLIHLAAFYSNTKQGREALKKVKAGEPLRKAEDVNSLPVDHPSDNDFSWAYFFATGDTGAVRRVVRALNFAKDEGSVERYAKTRSDADWKAAQRDLVFRTARWSLASNCKDDKQVLAICRKFLAGKSLTSTERNVLSEIVANPSKFSRMPGT